MIKKWMVLMVLLMACVSQAGNESFTLMTNANTDCLEGRFEWTYDPVWSVGILATYFEDAEDPREDWGAGLFARLIVDPNAEVPVANWFPAIGEWLNLPESLSILTYLIGKGEIYPCDKSNDIDVVASIGAGGEIGPVVIEYLYRIIEGGDSGNPLLDSKAVFFFGLKPIRF